MAVCKGTSVCFLTFLLFSSTLLYSPLHSHTHPCSHVHSPTLCTITRCQTLKADDSQTSKTLTHKPIDYYCYRHSTFPPALTSEASDKLQTHWDRSMWYYGTLHCHRDVYLWEAWYYEAWYCNFQYIICRLT
jgi:hypothetical protein